MTPRLNAFLIALGLLFGLPLYWLLLENPGRNAAPYPVSITRLRALADSIPGQRPDRVQVIVSGAKRVPGNFYAAGSGMRRRLFAVLSFRLPVPGAGPVIIDTGTTAALGKAAQLEYFLAGQQREIDASLAAASLILATNAQPLHLGGLAAFAAKPAAAVPLTHARLNARQVPRRAGNDPNPQKHIPPDHLPWPTTLVLRPAITGSRPQAMAPGVVVIPTGRPVPGAQMVYVRLAGGREYLFAGDVAPFRTSYDELRVRSNLYNWFGPREDRQAAMRWLITLAALQREAPGLVIVPGHDYEMLTDPKFRAGVESIVL